MPESTNAVDTVAQSPMTGGRHTLVGIVRLTLGESVRKTTSRTEFACDNFLIMRGSLQAEMPLVLIRLAILLCNER
jgi:hypothetical protein